MNNKLAAVIATAVLLFGCTQAPAYSATGTLKSYENYNAFFSLAYPAEYNLTVFNDSAQDVFVAVQTQQEEGVFVRASETKKTLEEEMNAMAFALGASKELGASQYPAQNATFNGVKAVRITAYVTIAGKRMRDERTVFVRNGRRYAVSSIVAEGNGRINEANREIIDSFRFLQASPIN